MWSIVVLSILSAEPDCNCLRDAGVEANSRTVTGTSRVATSENFEVQCHVGCCDARQLARTCEQWRDHLRNKWLGSQQQETWSPRCVVAVHAQRETYLAAVGRGGSQSYGSTWIDSRGKQISARRVDLLIDRQGRLSALGHELTHVVVADAFPGQQPPSWANEGMALLADSAVKQEAHARDVVAARRAGLSFHCAELLTLEGYPAAERIPAFYGQSAALVGILTKAGNPSDFVSFLRLADAKGHDQALRDVYGIADAGELEQMCQSGQTRRPANLVQVAAREVE